MLITALERIVGIIGLAALMAVLGASIPGLRSLSALDVFVCTFGLFVVAAAFSWAFRPETASAPSDPVEQGQDVPGLVALLGAQEGSSRLEKTISPSETARHQPDSPAWSLPPRPEVRSSPPFIDLEDPIIPHRTRADARGSPDLVPELSLDFDVAGGSVQIRLELPPSERIPPSASPAAPSEVSLAKPKDREETTEPDGRIADRRIRSGETWNDVAASLGTSRQTLDRKIKDANALDRASSTTMRAAGPKADADPVEVIRAKTAPDKGEAIPGRIPAETAAHSPSALRPVQADIQRPLWSPPRQADEAPDSAVLTWHGKGESIAVGSYTLTDPLVYVCDGRGSSREASCIDRRQTIGKPIFEPVGSLGYYPEYSRLSINQRANYLQWLAGGRVGPLSDIGYAFLYFYGLERRLLIEGQDLSPIVKEVVRLLETYTFSGSFDGYLSRFLSYTLARTDISTLKEKWFQAVFERTRAHRDEQHLAVGLAWLFSNERPLPPAWACRIARLDPRSPRSVVLERLPDQFNALFLRRYRDRYGDGMKLTAAKRDREVTYQPASPSRLSDEAASADLKPVKVAHVMGIQSQFAHLVQIWACCIEELKPLSRVVAKGADVSNRAAYEALPDELKAETEHPDKPRWDQLAVDQVQEDGTVILKVGALAEIQGYAEKPKLTAKQSEAIAQTAHSVGFMIEPDPRITNRAYGWEDHAAVFRPEERPSLPQGNSFAGAALLLELGMFIAAADGEIEEEEVNHIAGFLESQFFLDPPDARRLEALKRVFLSQHPSIAGIGKRLERIVNLEQVESIGPFLFGVAAANGAIEKAEISALRSAYRALGIDPKGLDRQLAEYGRIAREPVEVVAAPEQENRGEVIPPREAIGPRPSYVLNQALIKILRRESDQVKEMLAKAMENDEPEDPVETAPGPPADPRLEGLDGHYSAVLLLLLERKSWTRAEFDDLVRRHSLMTSGTLDVVNEWAYERFDDPILEEDGDSVRVHSHLVMEPS